MKPLGGYDDEWVRQSVFTDYVRICVNTGLILLCRCTGSVGGLAVDMMLEKNFLLIAGCKIGHVLQW